jgi:hypothetical protein
MVQEDSTLLTKWPIGILMKGYSSSLTHNGLRSCLRLDGQYALDSSLASPFTTFSAFSGAPATAGLDLAAFNALRGRDEDQPESDSD